jgi:hypothetical protein
MHVGASLPANFKSLEVVDLQSRYSTGVQVNSADELSCQTFEIRRDTGNSRVLYLPYSTVSL